MSSVVSLSESVSVQHNSIKQQIVALKGGAEVLRLPAHRSMTTVFEALKEAQAGILVKELPADDAFARVGIAAVLLKADLLRAEEVQQTTGGLGRARQWFASFAKKSPWSSQRD